LKKVLGFCVQVSGPTLPVTYMKPHQYGKVSTMIKLAAFQASNSARMKLHYTALASAVDQNSTLYPIKPKLLFRLNQPLFRPAVRLTPDTRNLTPVKDATNLLSAQLTY